VAVPNQPKSFFQEANTEEAQIFLDKMILALRSIATKIRGIQAGNIKKQLFL